MTIQFPGQIPATCITPECRDIFIKVGAENGINITHLVQRGGHMSLDRPLVEWPDVLYTNPSLTWEGSGIYAGYPDGPSGSPYVGYEKKNRCYEIITVQHPRDFWDSMK